MKINTFSRVNTYVLNAKNKSLNPAFSGYTRELKLTLKEEYEPFEKGKEPPAEIMYGRSKFIDDRLISREYTAQVNGPAQTSEYKERAIFRAIVASKEFPLGGRIEKKKSLFVTTVPYSHPETTLGKVYFSDRFEKVYQKTLKEHNYIVYAPGAIESKYNCKEEDKGDEFVLSPNS